MNLRKTIRQNKRIYLSIGQSYRDKNGKTKSRTIESLGYLDELVKEYADPIGHFTEVIRIRNEDNVKRLKPETLEIGKDAKLEIGSAERNIGYAAISLIYHKLLELDVFFNNHQRRFKVKYNINSIVKLLVFSRLLRPGSKRDAYNNRKWFFDKTDFSIDDLYRSLTYISDMREAVQLWMHERILEAGGRDTTFVYYDVTNYYFEIDKEDDLRKKGVNKEFRPSPIVQMGLFMDNDGIPMAYRLFPGNNNDCTTLIPLLAGVREKYGVGKMAVVADKGMNTAQNAYYIANGRGWYIFSQTVRGGTKELKAFVLNESGYEQVGEDFKIKHRQFTRHVKIEQTDGKPPIEADISEKQVVFYSRDYDVKAKRDREKVIAKAHSIINNPSGYNKHNVYGAAKYIRHLEYGDDGEIIHTKSIIQFDEEKLLEDEKYDGYYLIVSNCFDKSADWIVDKYRGLWEIEETFKVTKSDLEARPVYVSRREHIEAHFLTCFISLVIIRLLQKKLDGKYSYPRILHSLSHACCINMDTNRYMAFYFDEVLNYIEKTTGIDFSTKLRTLMDIKKMLGATK